MRTARLSLVGTVILGLLGGLSSVVLAQSADEGSGDFTLKIVEKLDWNGRPSEPKEGFNEFTMDGSFVIEAGDPRLSGNWTEDWNCREDLTLGFGTCVGSVRVENEGGTWLGRPEQANAKSPLHHLKWTVLEGQGDYAGLTAIVHGYGDKATALSSVVAGGLVHESQGGVIFDYGMPPMPEPPPERGLDGLALTQTDGGGNGGFTLRWLDYLTDASHGGTVTEGEVFGELLGKTESLLFEASDPRLSGIWTTVWNCRWRERPAPQVCVMSVRVENEGGSWLGWGGRTWAWSPPPRHILERTVLEGQGDYAGLTAIVHGYDAASPPFPEGGVIFDFGLPPMPELLGGMSPDATPTDVTPTPDVTLPGALLFDGFSDSALAQWVGKSEGAHSGEVLDDPVRPGNRVLRLSDVVGAGDVFSQPIAVTPGQEYALCFEYMGSPVAPYGANGAAIGIAEGTPGNHRWLAGTSTIGGIEQDLLVDDGTWQQVRVEFAPEIDGDAVSSFRIMLEDFEEPSGDVWFDDISLVPSDLGC